MSSRNTTPRCLLRVCIPQASLLLLWHWIIIGDLRVVAFYVARPTTFPLPFRFCTVSSRPQI